MSANLTHVLLLCDKKEKRNTAYLCFVPVLERSEKKPHCYRFVNKPAKL